MNIFFEKLLLEKLQRKSKPHGYELTQWQHEFVENIEAIQDEFKNYVSNFKSSGILIDELSKEQTELNTEKKWKTIPLFGYSYYNKKLFENFPGTFDLIKKWENNITLVMFSTTEPGAHIPAHKGNNKGVLRMQIGVDIQCPELCDLRVESRVFNVKEKEAIIFDDTYEHELNNRSNFIRTVLIIDFYKPLPFFYRILNKIKNKEIARSDYVQSVLNQL
jgi:ornithine lipid ester-linked acyl 2-hydroxylase